MNETLTVHNRELRRAVRAAEMNKLESVFSLHAKAYGLPVLETNYLFDVPDSEMELDFAHLPSKVGVEIQGGIWRKGGGAHSRPANIERDIRKINAAQMKGWLLILLTAGMAENGEGALLVKKAIEQRLESVS